jgi:hypothetical protein
VAVVAAVVKKYFQAIILISGGMSQDVPPAA